MRATRPEPDLDGIRALEQRLLDPAVRRSPQAVAALLSDDFVEFGRSGRIYRKDETVRSLAAEDAGASPRVIAGDHALRVLAENAVLLTYRTVRSGGGGTMSYALRSSIWTRAGDRWTLTFHQGTPTAPPARLRR